MDSFSFVKMHGLGNDFILVDERGMKTPQPWTGDRVARLCNRRTGIGADGVLLVQDGATGMAELQIWNADGSRSAMCGNGLRCVAKYLLEADRGKTDVRSIHVQVEIAGSFYACEGKWDEAGNQIVSVELSMGFPRFLRGEIPMTGPAGEEALGLPATLGDTPVLLAAVSMGNPHVVVWGLPADQIEHAARTWGPSLETDPLFPDRVNAGFAAVVGETALRLAVWERGSGFTQACGSGACAAVVTASRLGYVPPDQWIQVALPGGTLEVRFSLDGVHLRGPATTVFRGTASGG